MAIRTLKRAVGVDHLRQLTGRVPQPLRFELRRIAFHGRTVTCPICGNGVRGLHPHGPDLEVLTRRQVVGGMRRESDRCPVCHACDRTRLMKLYLQREVGVGTRRQDVLHVAPDFGLYLWLSRQPHITYTGSDIDADRYRHIPGMRSADLTSTPFKSDSFDVVICSHVLEHIPDDGAAMREMHRILRPGGRALVLVPLATDGLGTDEDPSVQDPAERERRFGQWDHVRLYGRDDFMARLRDSGFEVSSFDPFAAAPDLAQALVLNPLEVLPVARKMAG